MVIKIILIIIMIIGAIMMFGPRFFLYITAFKKEYSGFIRRIIRISGFTLVLSASIIYMSLN